MSLVETFQSLEGENLPALGKNICSNQPDVEVLALLMRDFPVTKAGFNQLRGEKEWVVLEVCFVSVGAAGYSSVPYNSNPKKNEKVDMKKLYENTGYSDETMIYAFEKGKTNKDKGQRCSKMVMEDAGDGGEEVDANVTTKRGMCIRNFMREESFSEESKFWVDPPSENVVSAGTMLYVQLSAQNVEQAKKGNILKFRKCKIADNSDRMVIEKAFTAPYREHGFPSSQEHFNEMTLKNKQVPSIHKQLYSGTSSYFTVKPGKKAFACYNSDENYFVIAEVNDNISEIRFDAKKILQATGCHDCKRALKLLTVALSMEQVYIITAQNASSSGLLLNHACEYKGMWISIDFKAMLGVCDIENYLSNGGHSSKIRILYKNLPSQSADENTKEIVVWCDSSHSVINANQKKSLIVFSVQNTQTYLTESFNAENTSTLVTDGVAGSHLPLEIYLIPSDALTEENLELLSQLGTENDRDDSGSFEIEKPNLTHLISLQLQPNNIVVNNGGQKRKRVDFGALEDTWQQKYSIASF